MSFGEYLRLVLVISATLFQGQLFAQEKAKAPASAKDCLDDFFLNCDALTANSCELVTGSVTSTDSRFGVYALDFALFRAQKMELKRKALSYLEGRSFQPKHGPGGAYLERKLIVGDEGFYGVGVNPPLRALDLTTRIPEGELEAYMERQDRLAVSHYGLPEICPATVMPALYIDPKQRTPRKAPVLYGRMKVIDEYTKESCLVGTWRMDVKPKLGTSCVRIMFDKRQGNMPTYVEWRRRDESKTDPDDPSSYTNVFNMAETKWSKVPKKGQDLWAPVRIVNKRMGNGSGQEWIIEATWRVDALQGEFFDADKINGDREGNPLAKIRRHMQSAADEAKKERDKAEKGDKEDAGK